MGTSKSFSETGHSMIPNWGDLSGSITRNCNGTYLSFEKKNNILKNYVSSLGGSSVGGRGGSLVGGRSSLKTARKLGSFFGAFSDSGGSIREALKSTGLINLEGKTVSDVINHLIEYCSGASSTIDDVAAKEASRHLLEDLFATANDIDEIEELLSKEFQTYTFEELIIKYFCYYVYEHLSKWFYEHLIKKKGVNDCNNLFRQIKDYIFESLKITQKTNPLQKIDWSSKEAERLIKNIQEDVFKVFE